MNAQTWSPTIDTSIPPETRIPLFNHWITSYFAHGDLSTRDPAQLSYVVPTPARAPSIYSMSAHQLQRILYDAPVASAGASDNAYMFLNAPHLNAAYKRACFDKDIRARFPHMKIWTSAGDTTASFAWNTLWALQDDEKAHGGGFIHFKVIERCNHFVSVYPFLCVLGLAHGRFEGALGRACAHSRHVHHRCGISVLQLV